MDVNRMSDIEDDILTADEEEEEEEEEDMEWINGDEQQHAECVTHIERGEHITFRAPSIGFRERRDKTLIVCGKWG